MLRISDPQLSTISLLKPLKLSCSTILLKVWSMVQDQSRTICYQLVTNIKTKKLSRNFYQFDCFISIESNNKKVCLYFACLL